MALPASPVQEELQPESQLRNHLAAAVRSINWTYALFWSISSTQPGFLTWTDGFYNGEVKTRKIVNSAELTADQLVMQRSEQLRELYEALLSGECDRRAARPVASLSPEDLGDTELYYVVCMTYAFRPGQGLPGRSFASNERVWMWNSHLADSKAFPRALLAKSTSIQTIVCIPLMSGVLELGTTDATTLPVMGCRRILFEEAGPSAPSRDSADSPSPKRLEINDMRVAVDVRSTEVPERSPRRSEPPQPGERDTIDSCIKVPEVLEAFKKCMGQIRTRCILTDQDQAMGVAIAKEFPGVVHKICRWHVVNKHMPHLTNLFGMYAKKNFKDKFYSVLNHPLTPVEFEAAWQELLDEFDLQKDGTLDSLYCQRQLYVPVYFKDQYCGRMASTQRSESSNFVMKKCFVNKHTALHRFAKKMLDFMHSRKMKESEESYHGMSKRLTRSKWPFEIQVSRIYTRNVFKDFEKKMIDCTAYDIEDNPIEGETCYLVTHTNRSSKISWGQHQFKVRANKENGEFHCECKEWQHTGLFCVHLLRAFMRIQLNSIPQHYILRRYTKYAQQELGFDRNDKLLVGADGVTQLYRIKDLTSLAMAAVRSGSMSRAAHIRTREVLAKLDKDNKEIPPDIGPSTTNMHQESPGEELSDCSESDDGYGDNTNDEQLAKRVTQELGQANVDGNEARESIKGKMVLATNLDAFGGEFVRNEVVLTNQTDMTTKDARVHEGCAPHSGEYHANDDRLISRVPPTRSKTKGRSIPPSEKKEITLGAKGVKKGTRKCSICGYYATHNARTCPKLQHNKERLEVLKNRMRGRPRGAQHKRSTSQHDSGGEEHNIGRQQDTKKCQENKYIDYESNDEQFRDTDMEG
ncbi:uncharacterized protein [Setaria viridis]